MRVRPGAMVRGAGVALACLTADDSKRSPIMIAGFACGWFLDRPGLQIFTVIPDSEEPWKRATVPFATSVASWSTAMLVATAALRRTRLPVPIAAVVLGGGLMVVDSLLADLGERRDAAKAVEPEPLTFPEIETRWRSVKDGSRGEWQECPCLLHAAGDRRCRCCMGSEFGRIRPGCARRRLPARELARDARVVGHDRHLVSRFSYGVTQELAAQVRAAGGAQTWFEKQLATAYDGSADGLADWWPDLHLGPQALWDQQVAETRGGYRVMYDYGRRLLVRRLISPRPVLEVMQEFWENLLNVPANGDSQFTWRARYGDVIRKRALGRFDKLLPAAIIHPAMLIYLNGANSTKDHPNENLARELLELHTVGVGAFDEDDVKAAARILTGYRIDDRKTGPSPTTAGPRHREGAGARLHPPPTRRRDGRAVTAEFLRYLARHPKTARRIARRLAIAFVSDDPPPALVERLAKVYLANGTAIKPVLRGAGRVTRVRRRSGPQGPRPQPGHRRHLRPARHPAVTARPSTTPRPRA